MNNIFKYTGKLVLCATVALSSCSEDFLDREPSEYITEKKLEEVAKTSPDIQKGSLLGAYAMMFQTGTGGTNLAHDDFGQKGYDIYSDLLSGDMVLAGYNYGWYSDVARFKSTVDYTDTDNYKPWRYYYRIINQCNSVIDALGGQTEVPESDENKHSKGQALALRAHAYFYLANLFATEYDADAEILPIYTSLSDDMQPLSTTTEVYALIVEDLTKAIDYLGSYTRSSNAKHEVDVNVARGILAYAYAAMGNNDKVIELTTAAIDESGATILPLEEVTENGFNSVTTPSWMWGMDLTMDQGLDLVSWWGQVDLFTYSYAWAGDPKTMDLGLYASMRETDSRKGQFSDPWEEGILYPLNKFFHEDRAIGGQREVTTDYVYMRVEEMYLLKAEAEANKGLATANATLKALVEQRDSDPSYIDALSGQALKEEIYRQTRIELWGEGKSYLSMKRNKLTINREGHIENNISMDYNDERLTLCIPYKEMEDNPFISFK